MTGKVTPHLPLGLGRFFTTTIPDGESKGFQTGQTVFRVKSTAESTQAIVNGENRAAPITIGHLEIDHSPARKR